MIIILIIFSIVIIIITILNYIKFDYIKVIKKILFLLIIFNIIYTFFDIKKFIRFDNSFETGFNLLVKLSGIIFSNDERKKIKDFSQNLFNYFFNSMPIIIIFLFIIEYRKR